MKKTSNEHTMEYDINKKVNNYIQGIREYKVASHEIWHIHPEDRSNYLKLDWNEATIPPSPLVYGRIKELVDKGNFFNLYPETKNGRLMKQLAQYVDLPEEYLQYFSSSDSLHEYICRVYLNSYSRVLILAPSYDNFRLTAEASGAEIIFSEMAISSEIDINLFEVDIKNYKPTMIYICNPNNPTGIQHPVQYIEYLLKSYPQTIFLIDEAYWEFSQITSKNLTKNYKNILISRTFSKAFGLANFRIGYLISNPINIQIINKIRNAKSVSSFAQEAAIAALEDAEYMFKYVEEVNNAKQYLYTSLKNMSELGEAVWSYGNFMLLKCHTADIKSGLLLYLNEKHIYVRDMTQSPSVLKCIRITIGTRVQMETVVLRLNEFCEKIRNGKI